MPSSSRKLPMRASRNARPTYHETSASEQDDSQDELTSLSDEDDTPIVTPPPRRIKGRKRLRMTAPRRRVAPRTNGLVLPDPPAHEEPIEIAEPIETAEQMETSASPESPIELSSDSDTSASEISSSTPPIPFLQPPSNRQSSSNSLTSENGTMNENEDATITLSTAEKRRKTMREKVFKLHPELRHVWDELVVPPIADPVEQPIFLNLKLLPYQKEGLGWLLRQEEELAGGLLADEMGMGKTISMISLMLIRRRSPTLIIAPTVAIKQWLDELTTHVHPDGRFSILLYHGSKRCKDSAILNRCDILITSYSVVESCFRKQAYGFKRKAGLVKEPSVLHTIQWERIILDESHAIKDRVTGTARAVFHLQAKAKWALSGTPLQNRVGELYSVIRFLRLDPFGYYYCRACPCKSLFWRFVNGVHCEDCGHRPMQHFCHWNSSILKPIQNYGASGEGLVAFEKLGKLLDKYMLRRTKDEKADDLGLPPRHIVVRNVFFNAEERDFYTSLYSDSKRQFATYIAAGTVLNNYANIFELLTKMRQAASHPDLVLSRFKSKEQAVCGLCHDAAEDPVVSKCKHVFCREDARQYIESAEPPVLCPVCFTKLIVNLDVDEIVLDKPRRSIINKIDMDMWRSSSKIEALVEELYRLKQENYTIKSIVFSQYVSFLDLIQWRLKKANFECVKLDGRMSIQQRDSVIKAFTNNAYVTVFLISLKAGGVALNLTEASQVFIMDPWWNPAAEDQAMDRIHRLGQYRPIRITRIIIQDSIEERIIQLQAKKQALFQSTVGKDVDALSRLSEDDLRFLFVL